MLRTVVRVALVSALSVSVSDAQAPRARALTVEDYYRIKTVGAPSISVDARWVAFTVSTRVEETNANTSEVWLVPVDASEQGTDRWAIEQGYVSLTPLRLDLTDHPKLDTVRKVEAWKKLKFA